MGAWFTTREAVANALDIATTARVNPDIDRAVEAASRYIEGKDCLNRRILPWTGTHTIEWPTARQGEPAWVARLGYSEVISATEVKAAGAALTGWTLEPSTEGPPFTRIEMPESGAGFTFGIVAQRNLEITGLFGYGDDRADGGALDAAISDTVGVVTVTKPGRVGVGSTLIIDDERMTVTSRAYAATTATLTADITDSTGDTDLAVTDGSRFEAGQIILVGTERMRVDVVAGNTLGVSRAADGSIVKAHLTGVAVWDSGTLTVDRGQAGTVAAVHADAAPISVWKAPGPIESLCVAEAISILENDKSAWARVVGTGDNQREAKGSSVEGLRARVKSTYGRKHRMSVV